MDPIILIPGLACDATVFQHQTKRLEKLTTIIVPDLSRPDTPTGMVAAVLAVAPPRFALAGHSMGGWVALEVMRHAAPRVSRLCLLNTTALLDSEEKAAARRKLIALATEHHYDELIERLLAAFVYQQHCKDEVKTMLARNIDALITQERAMQQRDDGVPILRLIHCPTTIVQSNKDAVFNMDDAELMHQHITHSHLHEINDCGHMSPMEMPEEVTDILLKALLDRQMKDQQPKEHS